MKRSLFFNTFFCFLAVQLNAATPAPTNDEDDNGYSQISIFAKAIQLLRQDYVDADKTSYHELITAAMKGMLSSLDPHSQ